MENTAPRPVFTLTVLEILDRTFLIYRENFVGLIALCTLVIVPVTLLSLLATDASNANIRAGQLDTAAAMNSSLLVCGLGLLSSIAGVLQFVFIYAPITYLTSETLMGRKVTIREAFSSSRHRFSTLGCGFILLVITTSVFAAFIFGVGAALNCAPLFAAFGVVLYIAVAAYSQLSPVAVLENTSNAGAVNRAYTLGKARFWKVAGTTLFLTVITLVITTALTLLGGLLLSGGLTALTNANNNVAVNIISILISILTTPLLPIAMTLLYYDIRTRTEGLDLALQSLDNPDARPRDVPAPPRTAPFDRQDLINIVIITAVTIGAALLLGATLQALLAQYFPQLGQLAVPRR